MCVGAAAAHRRRRRVPLCAHRRHWCVSIFQGLTPFATTQASYKMQTWTNTRVPRLTKQHRRAHKPGQRRKLGNASRSRACVAVRVEYSNYLVMGGRERHLCDYPCVREKSKGSHFPQFLTPCKSNVPNTRWRVIGTRSC